MRDTELYQQILGLERPWRVEAVQLNIAEKRVDVHLIHAEGQRWPCPDCARELAGYDHAEERVWRHLDTCQFQTHLHARVPRVNCPAHGIKQVAVPWAEPRGRFTLLMERLIIDVLQETGTVSGAVALLGITWDQGWAVMQRAVERGQERKEAKVLEKIGVDEKAFKKGQSYMTLVCDLDGATVEHVAEGRTTESLAGFYRSLSEAQLWGIKAVAMDMWDPYVQATLQYVPIGFYRIVFDRFHIMQHLNDAVDKVRLGEHRDLQASGGADADLLKGTKHLWLYARENLPDQHRARWRQLAGLNLKVGRAWALKETLRSLWDYTTEGWARRFFNRWYGWAVRSRLSPLKKVARMLKGRLEQIINYCHAPVTNGVAEGINSKIMTIKRKACGFANPAHFKTAIYFHCGGLDLYPR
jgi:transposase